MEDDADIIEEAREILQKNEADALQEKADPATSKAAEGGVEDDISEKIKETTSPNASSQEGGEAEEEAEKETTEQAEASLEKREEAESQKDSTLPEEHFPAEGANLVGKPLQTREDNVEKEFLPDSDPNVLVVEKEDVEEEIQEKETVQVVKPEITKEWLGGFRDSESGAQYHHARTQTEKTPKKTPVKLTRDTQTFQQKTCSQQTNREYGTQMARKDLVISNENDKILTPREYLDSDLLQSIQEEKIVVCQCAVRQWLARREARRRFEVKQAESALLEARMQEILHERTEKVETVERRKQNPKRKSDFQLLEKEVIDWRIKEARKVNEKSLPEKEQVQGHLGILQTQVEIMRKIEEKRNVTRKANSGKRKAACLRKMCEPKRWPLRDGSVIDVETPQVLRAKELGMLYQALENTNNVDRPDILKSVMQITAPYQDIGFVQELFRLIMREFEMHDMGRPKKSFVGLRQRTKTLFYTFITDPECNPALSLIHI